MVSRALGALVQKQNMQGEDSGASLGSLMAPAQTPEEQDFQGKVQQNMDWLQAPETQAALMSFALSIMQPVGSPQELMGQFARSVGAGLQAAGSVQTSEIEARDAADKKAMEQAEFNLRRRKLQLEESQFEEELKTKGQVSRSIIITSNNPLNKSFNLGIPEGSSAKVEVTYDKTGRILSADLETVDAPKEKTISETSRLLNEAAEAEAAGDSARAKTLRDKLAKDTRGDESEVAKLDREIAEALDKGDVELANQLKRRQQNLARQGEPEESGTSKLIREAEEAEAAGNTAKAKALRDKIKLETERAPPEESNIAKMTREAQEAEARGDLATAKTIRDKLKLETERAPPEESPIAKMTREAEAAEAAGNTAKAKALRDKIKLETERAPAEPSNINKLQKERDEAIIQGREDDALALQAQIDKLNAQTPPDESNLATLQRERDAAIAAGDTKKAAELDLEIKTESAGESFGDGRIPVADPSAPGGVRMATIPGSKAAEEESAASLAKNTRTSQGMFMSAIVRTRVDQALRLIENTPNPDLRVTGIGALGQYLPASDARELAGYIATLKANLGFEQLQKMREASPTGGALGPVSDFENEMLQSVIAKLDQYGDAEYMKEQLRLIKAATTAIVTGKTADIANRMEQGEITPDEALLMMESLFQQEALDAAQKAAIKASPGTAATAPAEGVSQKGVPSKTATPPAAARPQAAMSPALPATPEEKMEADVLAEMERTREIAEKQFAEGLVPEPNDLSERESDAWDLMNEDERRTFVVLRNELAREEAELKASSKVSKTRRRDIERDKSAQRKKRAPRSVVGTGRISNFEE